VSCAKTAETIAMQFEMLSWMGPGNMYYMGVDACTGRDTFRASGGYKNIVKHSILWGCVKG